MREYDHFRLTTRYTAVVRVQIHPRAATGGPGWPMTVQHHFSPYKSTHRNGRGANHGGLARDPIDPRTRQIFHVQPRHATQTANPPWMMMIARLVALSHAQTRRIRQHSRGPTQCENTAGNGGANHQIHHLISRRGALAWGQVMGAKGQIGHLGAADLRIEASSALKKSSMQARLHLPDATEGSSVELGSRVCGVEGLGMGECGVGCLLCKLPGAIVPVVR